MTQEGQLPPPPVMWAQRRDILFVTICLEDCKNPVINLEPLMIYFKGVGGTEKKMHQVTIHLYAEIIPDKTIKVQRGRAIELVFAKKDEGPYWPRLTRETTKAHWLRNDFNRWQDEDDSEEETGIGGSRDDLEEMMRQMGGLGGSGDGKIDFNDLRDEGEAMDSDDDDLPDLIE